MTNLFQVISLVDSNFFNLLTQLAANKSQVKHEWYFKHRDGVAQDGLTLSQRNRFQSTMN